MADEKPAVDWSEIERDYRTSPMSVREIARWYGITEAAIRKRAKRDGWSRPPAAVGSQDEEREPEQAKVYVGTVLTPENTTPEAIVGRGRNLVMRMMDELDASTSRLGELEALIVSSTDEADATGQRAALMQAVSLKQRSDVLKALATAAKTLGETAAPQGVKKARQEAGERVSRSPGKFATPSAPRLAVDNTGR